MNETTSVAEKGGQGRPPVTGGTPGGDPDLELEGYWRWAVMLDGRVGRIQSPRLLPQPLLWGQKISNHRLAYLFLSRFYGNWAPGIDEGVWNCGRLCRGGKRTLPGPWGKENVCDKWTRGELSCREAIKSWVFFFSNYPKCHTRKTMKINKRGAYCQRNICFLNPSGGS